MPNYSMTMDHISRNIARCIELAESALQCHNNKTHQIPEKPNPRLDRAGDIFSEIDRVDVSLADCIKLAKSTVHHSLLASTTYYRPPRVPIAAASSSSSAFILSSIILQPPPRPPPSPQRPCLPRRSSPHLHAPPSLLRLLPRWYRQPPCASRLAPPSAALARIRVSTNGRRAAWSHIFWLRLARGSHEGLQVRLWTRSYCIFHCLVGLQLESVLEPCQAPSCVTWPFGGCPLPVLYNPSGGGGLGLLFLSPSR